MHRSVSRRARRTRPPSQPTRFVRRRSSHSRPTVEPVTSHPPPARLAASPRTPRHRYFAARVLAEGAPRNRHLSRWGHGLVRTPLAPLEATASCERLWGDDGAVSANADAGIVASHAPSARRLIEGAPATDTCAARWPRSPLRTHPGATIVPLAPTLTPVSSHPTPLQLAASSTVRHATDTCAARWPRSPLRTPPGATMVPLASNSDAGIVASHAPSARRLIEGAPRYRYLRRSLAAVTAANASRCDDSAASVQR
jgi:hypothetical protein